MYIANLIKDNRKAARLTQQELAQHAGVAKNLIYQLEQGKTSIRFENFLKVCHVLNIKIQYVSPLDEQNLENTKTPKKQKSKENKKGKD